MPPPRTTDHDDEALVRYVLGLLPDEARERLDEASIVNDEVAARLRAAETDLIDSYVRGQLSGATLERFESYYLSSPRRRENVRLAASFLERRQSIGGACRAGDLENPRRRSDQAGADRGSRRRS